MIARLEGASKVYQTGDQRIVALQPTTLDLVPGELMLIIGPSGSGKTTLLSLLGCVIYPTEGRLFVQGQEISQLNDRELARLRLNTIGFVFQNFNLIAPLTAEENVMMPLRLQGVPRRQATERVRHALEMVGMSDRRRQLPKQLSGGQQQRVAIARALVTDPALILCDEPTASLDKGSMGIVMEELRALADQGKSVAVVTHDPRLEPYAHRMVEVESGIVSAPRIIHPAS
ncbi:MAG: ABC transporter ATP-binding protein [Bacteroidia bacterium]|nr:ABC transporter ATP-binding protein [Bacteroidia bacterium]